MMKVVKKLFWCPFALCESDSESNNKILSLSFNITDINRATMLFIFDHINFKVYIMKL